MLDHFNKKYSRARDSMKQKRILIPNQENRKERGVRRGNQSELVHSSVLEFHIKDSSEKVARQFI